MNSRLRILEKKILMIHKGHEITFLFRGVILTDPTKWKVVLPKQKPGEVIPKIPKATKYNSYKNKENQTVIICNVLSSPQNRKTTGKERRELIKNYVISQRKHFAKYN